VIGHVARVGSPETFRILVRKPVCKVSTGRPGRRWNNVKIHLPEIQTIETWRNLIQDRVQWQASYQS